MNALWTAEALAAATGGELTPGCAGASVGGVAIDSRTLAPGALFIALVGDRSDGHAHVDNAWAAGAALAMVRRGTAGSGPALLVDDTMRGLEALGRAGRARLSGRAVAVTGSVGKTTVKEMLRAALGACGTVHAAEASYNNHWGVPLTLARLPADTDFCVSEIGMNHPGEIAPLAAMVRPDVAIVTTIGTPHVGNMGGTEAIAAEKASLFGGLAPEGAAVLPIDAAHRGLLEGAVPRGARIVRFGTGADAQARLVDAASDAGGCTVRAVIEGRPIALRLAAPGRHMAMNAVAVLAAAAALDVDVEAAASGLAQFRPGAGRGLTRTVMAGAAVLLDESYNASSASVRASLEILSVLRATRRVAVLGDMLELGAFAEAEHVGLASDAARCADLVFACGLHSRALFDALPDARRGEWAEDSERLAPIVARALRPGDAVLVKGSNGSRMRLVVDAIDRLGQDAGPLRRTA